ncbi:hypothetical protein A3F28_03570 [Candidatus Uhrbacteria bacterium RIFCSPHIGHO2_12_FULL_57_11]|uniref:HTH arsR-type domain-containing protein n=2 Tax=Candidatus Uhriibacteriota TaxID=1752732 RepID=A0A1F7UJA5_9BACT|nr:MAG: hypothetical protein A3D72_01290 [Candidatus Uhrbacteria bacterium RIFCSPHIGHO2_02_FULL_57_19]OGL78339.1 MAG: hypothetical protein A3F28_03570 [Candidatus Uhrbacteria bacterium RIFCSPHIGHO2_12_FULL_57_11]
MSRSSSGLEHLFGSLTRIKVLRLFLRDPQTPFYVRQMARGTRSHINAVRRELQNLERLGAVRAEQAVVDTENPIRGPASQRKYYRLNPGFVLLPELRALITKADLLLEQSIARKLHGLGSVSYLALTGRFVGDPLNQTDMLVVGSVNRRRLREMVRSFESELGRELNYTVMTSKEFKYRKDVTDRFLYSILEGKRVVLVDLPAGRQGRAAGGILV